MVFEAPTTSAPDAAVEDARSRPGEFPIGAQAAQEALAVAARVDCLYGRVPTTGRAAGGFRWRLPTLAAFIAAVTAMALAPARYPFGAEFRLTGEVSAEWAATLRTELSDFLMRSAARADAGAASTQTWSVTSPSPTTVRFSFESSGRAADLERAQVLSSEFLDTTRNAERRRRATPTEVEAFIARRAEELRNRLADAQARVEAAQSSEADLAARVQQRKLGARITDARTQYTARRTRLTDAAEGFSQLISDGDPKHAIVPADKRRTALEADDALQQDLRELKVTLAELRAHLLRVDEGAAGKLQALLEAARRLCGDAPRQATSSAAGEFVSLAVAELPKACDYRSALVDFAGPWTEEFAAIHQTPADAVEADLFDRYQKLRSLLSDFLYATTKTLAALRAEVDRLTADPAKDSPRDAGSSDPGRSFRVLQAAHHQFEFAGGAIEAPSNFRVDTALRRAMGLRQRAQDRINAVDARLQSEAHEQAKKTRAAAVAEAETFLSQAQSEVQQAADELFALQGGYLQAADSAERMAVREVRAEMTAERLETTRQDLERTQRDLGELSSRRVGAAPRSVELVQTGILGSALNPGSRLAIILSAGLLTFVSMLLGEWYVLRVSAAPAAKSHHLPPGRST